MWNYHECKSFMVEIFSFYLLALLHHKMSTMLTTAQVVMIATVLKKRVNGRFAAKTNRQVLLQERVTTASRPDSKANKHQVNLCF